MTDILYFEHIALRTGDDRVISKFGSGHVWEYNLNKVSTFYGKYNCFHLLKDVDMVKKVKEYSNKIGYKPRKLSLVLKLK